MVSSRALFGGSGLEVVHRHWGYEDAEDEYGKGRYIAEDGSMQPGPRAGAFRRLHAPDL